ncbi:hypothetical protein AC579_4479 [Pseudocercospora musae]|uniref:Uncharacterized protein n=1 Tax=Pseudocercospora musae TaxID=113226 RepID=A0A139H5E6_9PEZI|nr:hypothetical protein AC579_4479 [Pseudocercospora musae]
MLAAQYQAQAPLKSSSRSSRRKSARLYSATIAEAGWSEMTIGGSSVVVPSSESDSYDAEEDIPVAHSFDENKPHHHDTQPLSSTALLPPLSETSAHQAVVPPAKKLQQPGISQATARPAYICESQPV